MKTIRKLGSMEAVITPETNYQVQTSYNGNTQIVAEVSTKEIKSFGNGKKHVVLIDFGYKKSILDQFNQSKL